MRRLTGLVTGMAVTAALVIALTGCRPAGVVKITQSDHGKDVDVAQGQTFLVSLAGNPTTGYQWVTPPGSALVKYLGSSYKPESKQIGAPGIVTLRFKALKPGRKGLTLRYVRPWEKGVLPRKTFIVTIVVK